MTFDVQEGDTVTTAAIYTIANPRPEDAICPVHGPVGDKVMTMSTYEWADYYSSKEMSYGEVCTLCYFDWIIASLPKIQRKP